ncbi:hypothetical protein [Flexibacterium corallicola]|uniref:hypothetical protein n=1 Tax=Flexibacterium corallicola TaxID=3037259 RepID=UPI00286F885F|nr:hypothetical protein [Pseudovibrio sp. M1P-2-3]
MIETLISNHTDDRELTSLLGTMGRQRMLSQRIGLLLLNYLLKTSSKADPETDLLTSLDKALQDFQEAHELLLHGDKSRNLPAMVVGRVKETLYGKRCSIQVIDEFMQQTRDILEILRKDEVPEPQELEHFTSFILSEVLEELQAVVIALEKEIQDFMGQNQHEAQKEKEKLAHAISKIQKASNYSRMVALNARISAHRAGKYGSEFGKLTEEMKGISDSITENSAHILQHLQVK